MQETKQKGGKIIDPELLSITVSELLGNIAFFFSFFFFNHFKKLPYSVFFFARSTSTLKAAFTHVSLITHLVPGFPRGEVTSLSMQAG